MGRGSTIEESKIEGHEFIKEQIIHRFGIPRSITANQGTIRERLILLLIMGHNSSYRRLSMLKSMDKQRHPIKR